MIISMLVEKILNKDMEPIDKVAEVITSIVNAQDITQRMETTTEVVIALMDIRIIGNIIIIITENHCHQKMGPCRRLLMVRILDLFGIRNKSRLNIKCQKKTL